MPSSNGDGLLNRLTLPRLALGTYVVGYFAYLIPAAVWGWGSDDVNSYSGFVAWQALLYAPLWPFILFIQFYRLIIPLL